MLLPGTFDFTLLHTYILLTKGEVKMVAYLPSSLCVFMDRGEVSLRSTLSSLMKGFIY